MELLKEWQKLPDRDKYKASIPIAKVFRNEASERVKRLIKAQGKSNGFIADQIGVNRGGFSRNLKGNFNCPLDSLRKLAYEEFNVSIHYIYFGEQGVTRLPRLVEELVTKNNLPSLDSKLGDPTQSIKILDRLTELTQDVNLPLTNLCGLEASQDLKMTFRRLEREPDFTPRINFFIFMAMYFSTTMDYFIGRNYARFTDISAHGKVIRDKEKLKFLRLYLELEKEEQAKVGGLTLAGDWKKREGIN